MPRPKTKAELLDLSQKNYKALFQLINSFSDDEINIDFQKGPMNRNIRDVLAHIHHWHLMMLDWHKIGMNGAKPEMPAKGYTWKTVPSLNKKIWQIYQNSNLETVKTNLNESYSKLQILIENHTNEELFEKKRYKWTGTTSLGAYLISSSSSHYDWAIKLIKKYKK